LKNLVINILKTPLWLFSLFTEAKTFRENPIIGSRFLNQLGLHIWRIKLAYRLADYRRPFLEKGLSVEKQAEYQQNGYTVDFDFLPADEFAAIQREVFESDWLLREMRQGGTVTRRVFLNHEDLLKTHPKLAAFMTMPAVLSRMRYVAGIGGEPIFSIQAVLSEANVDSDPQMTVHEDTFHSNAKAWFFLEQVTEDDGPFAYVVGSHKLTPERLMWEKKQSLTAKHHPVIYHARGSFRATMSDLQEMNLSAPQKMVVPANTLLIGNTLGFHHRSSANKASCRVEVYATLRRNPFLPWIGLDVFSLPHIKKRTGDYSILFLTRLQKLGLRKMAWRPVGIGKIKSPPRS
jgi:hypothetical protein